MNPQRRQLLLGLGALPWLSTAGAAVRERVDVVVIGAGLAGLEAALQLSARGAKLRVLEASERVGGRLRTVERGGLRFETGATDVAASYRRTLARMSELGIKQQLPAGQMATALTLNLGGENVAVTDWASTPYNRLQGEARALPPPQLLPVLLSKTNPLAQAAAWTDAAHAELDRPLAAYLSEQGVAGEALRLAEVGANYSSLWRTSALDAYRRDALRKQAGSVGGVYQIEGGSSRLPEAMAAKIRDQILLDSPARAVRREGRRWVVYTDRGSIQARAVIIAVPAACIGDLKLEPALDPVYAPLMQQRLCTAITQVHLRPRRAYWESDGLAPAMWCDGALERVFSVNDREGRPERLIVWLNGAGAERLDALSREDLQRYVLLEMQRLRPASAGALEVLEVHSWSKAPWARGAYVEIGAGQCAAVKEALAALPARLTRTHPGLAFAGEHLCFDEPGIEAAITSGEAAVRSVERSL